MNDLLHGIFLILTWKPFLNCHMIVWMNLKDIILSEINWSQRDKHCYSTYMKYLQQPNYGDWEQNGGCQGLWVANGESLLNGDMLFVWEDEILGGVAQQCECT